MEQSSSLSAGSTASYSDISNWSESSASNESWPLEVLQRILSYLDLNELINMSNVCRRWKYAIDERVWKLSMINNYIKWNDVQKFNFIGNGTWKDEYIKRQNLSAKLLSKKKVFKLKSSYVKVGAEIEDIQITKGKVAVASFVDGLPLVSTYSSSGSMLSRLELQRGNCRMISGPGMFLSLPFDDHFFYIPVSGRRDLSNTLQKVDLAHTTVAHTKFIKLITTANPDHYDDSKCSAAIVDNQNRLTLWNLRQGKLLRDYGHLTIEQLDESKEDIHETVLAVALSFSGDRLWAITGSCHLLTISLIAGDQLEVVSAFIPELNLNNSSFLAQVQLPLMEQINEFPAILWDDSPIDSVIVRNIEDSPKEWLFRRCRMNRNGALLRTNFAIPETAFPIKAFAIEPQSTHQRPSDTRLMLVSDLHGSLFVYNIRQKFSGSFHSQEETTCSPLMHIKTPFEPNSIAISSVAIATSAYRSNSLIVHIYDVLNGKLLARVDRKFGDRNRHHVAAIERDRLFFFENEPCLNGVVTLQDDAMLIWNFEDQRANQPRRRNKISVKNKHLRAAKGLDGMIMKEQAEDMQYFEDEQRKAQDDLEHRFIGRNLEFLNEQELIDYARLLSLESTEPNDAQASNGSMYY